MLKIEKMMKRRFLLVLLLSLLFSSCGNGNSHYSNDDCSSIQNSVSSINTSSSSSKENSHLNCFITIPYTETQVSNLVVGTTYSLVIENIDKRDIFLDDIVIESNIHDLTFEKSYQYPKAYSFYRFEFYFKVAKPCNSLVIYVKYGEILLDLQTNVYENTIINKLLLSNHNNQYIEPEIISFSSMQSFLDFRNNHHISTPNISDDFFRDNNLVFIVQPCKENNISTEYSCCFISENVIYFQFEVLDENDSLIGSFDSFYYCWIEIEKTNNPLQKSLVRRQLLWL